MRSEGLVLTVDGAVNLALGIALAIFPEKLARLLGIPLPATPFYASILGGVLIGVGTALLIHRFGGGPRVTGLGIEGAIVINLSAAGVLVAWLVGGHLSIPDRGRLFLWMVAILVFGIGTAEIMIRLCRSTASHMDRPGIGRVLNTADGINDEEM
jgi:hypothetical protein